jgi:2'-5' RNA ligase
MTNTIRSFIGIEIPQEIQKELTSIITSARLFPENGFRPVRMGMIHLTLKFLGDTAMDLVPKIQEGLSLLARSQKTFQFKIQGIGAFPSWDLPRIIWVGLVDTHPLTNLAHNIDELCKGFGFQEDKRPFSPHLTLARVSDRANFDKLKPCVTELKQSPPFTIGIVTAQEITFFKSDLQPGGSVYTAISKHPFSAGIV